MEKNNNNNDLPSVSGIAGCHHVLGVEHLLSKFGNSKRSVLLAASGRERGESRHEEVEAREGNHVDGQLPQVGVELPREAQRSRDAGHRRADEMIQVAICRRRQF